MNGYNEKLEQKLFETTKQKEQSDRQLLLSEIIIGVFSVIILFSSILVAAFVQIASWLKILLVVFGFVLFIIGAAYAIKIEQVAGYYKCAKCGYRHVPAYSNVLWSMHIGRTRYMKCPECKKRSWQKKVLSKRKK